MIQNDLLGVCLVYSYVFILLILTNKILSKKYPFASRKILHIMVGNIAFFLPIFQTREVMVFIAAGPFIFLTYLMSPHSPIKSIRDKLSESGHSLGLVYYSIAWTILAYFFFDNKEIIAIGIIAMSYGDGFASIIGVKFGKHKYKIFNDEKTIEGSFSLVIFSLIFFIIALFYYNIEFSLRLFIVLILISIFAAFFEGFTPKGLDNLSVPFVAAILYWILIYKIGFLV